MVDNDVLGTDRREAVAAEVADAFGEARRVWREQQVRPIVHDQLAQVRDAEDAVGDMRLVRARAKFGRDQGTQFLRHVGVHAEMDDNTAPTTLQRGLVGPDEIFRLFLEFDVGVADQAEPALPGQAESREHPVEEQAEQVLQHHEPDRFADSARQPDESLDLARQRQQGTHALAILLAQQQQGHDKAHVRDEREGMRRIDGERREHREHPLHEPALQPLHVVA